MLCAGVFRQFRAGGTRPGSTRLIFVFLLTRLRSKTASTCRQNKKALQGLPFIPQFRPRPPCTNHDAAPADNVTPRLCFSPRSGPGFIGWGAQSHSTSTCPYQEPFRPFCGMEEPADTGPSNPLEDRASFLESSHWSYEGARFPLSPPECREHVLPRSALSAVESLRPYTNEGGCYLLYEPSMTEELPTSTGRDRLHPLS